uniref:Methylated-DNA--protein-cysteine methyltransferase n=1 Tax=Arion vulgaris TaxID=1028688 RepID=A0A0B7ALN1_9EUPU
MEMANLIRNTQCKGKIFNFILTSPIGDIKITSCLDGLHSVMPCAEDDSNFSPDERRPVLLKPGQKDGNLVDCDPANKCFIWLKNYFTDRVASSDLPPLCNSVVKTDSFCAHALQLLPKAAPMGTTVTYKDLARLCGNEKACRAAGHAMATNPVALLIPCHRVITSSGGPGNYAHGKKNSTKIWLLKFEQGPLQGTCKHLR